MFLIGSLSSCVASTAAACACTVCTCASREAMVRSARLAWSFLFTLSMILAWILRDFAKPLLMKIPWIVKSFNKGSMPSDEWFGAQAVYRISLGNLLLFGSLALVMMGVKRTSDRRDTQLHHGSWLIKAALWTVCILLPFLLPPSVINAYSWVARFGSPLFLLTQMVIVVDVTQAWNDAWVEAGDEDETWLYGLLAATLGALGGCVALAALCFHFFAPASQDCSLNLTLISLTLVLVVVMALTSFHPAVEAGSLFPAAAVGLYVSYMGYSALQSEPRDYACNGLGARLGAASGATLAGGMLLTLLSVVYSAFRAGSNTQTFAGAWAGGNGAGAEPLLAGDAELTSAGLDGEDAPVPYCYAQFYAVFALASMYIAMLMTGWGATGQPKASDAAAGCSDAVDVGWTSVWVKIVTQWVAAALYCWTLLAPSLFPDRVFG
ncbi:putative serine incorporator [Auxenochlorella protothecoides]|uniref:Putative serine incorporator n=1 Tax=Auxenochlorella protothecoides TaxID=3075 RepID=A0A087SG80_AUXPR|nr:putative serine incorporator [Auxenochlorella protothecoides]KFM24734.1 putative serine incorporator [Auxenochlorella protothecoides]